MASIYRHPTLRAAINVVVVRLVILKHDGAGPAISENAQDTLQQFCRWQASYNDANDDDPNHHDVAILLTRSVIDADGIEGDERTVHLFGPPMAM